MRAPGRQLRVGCLRAGLLLWLSLWGGAGGAEILWDRAEKAYARSEFEQGHATLRDLLSANPGSDGMAARSLERMLREVKRQRWHHRLLPRENPWGFWAAERYCALEERRVVSAHSEMMQLAVDLVIDGAVRRGQVLPAHELVVRLRRENPHDLYWQLSEAELLRKLDAAGTTVLFAKLEEEMQGSHGEEAVRKRLATINRERRHWRQELRPPFFPAEEKVSLSQTNGAEVFPQWEQVLVGTPKEVAALMHRFLLSGDTANLLPWGDESGSIELGHLLKLHLQERGGAELVALRRLQSHQFAHEEFPSKLSEAETLAVFRRFPWAPRAQQLLLYLGNELLWEGKAEAARRCFQEVVDHAIAGPLRDRARIGLWTATIHAGSLKGADQLLGGLDPETLLPWQGQEASAASILQTLFERRPKIAQPKEAVQVKLSEVTTRVLPLQESVLWPGQVPGTVDLQWMADDWLLVSGRTILSLFDRKDFSKPMWRASQPLHGNGANFHPGYFRPTRVGETLYLRSGDELMPTTIVAVDINTGRARWSADFPELKKRGRAFVPLGDPVFADGQLFTLQWSNRMGRSLSLACWDPQRQRVRWESTVVVGRGPEDRNDMLRRASPHRVIFGNRVTVHEGAIYSVSNSGVVARSDLRDGRTEWIHNYRSTVIREPRVGRLGAAPLVVGDLLICLPRDSGSVFALQLSTGRKVWENPLVSGAELVGQVDDLLVVRGGGVVAGIQTRNGAIQWFRPLRERVAGRCQLVGSSFYLGQRDRLLRIDARTGATLESKPWEVGTERVLAFTVRDRDLVVVTDSLSNDRELHAKSELEWHGPYQPDVLIRNWTEGQHSVRRELPPPKSPLRNLGYSFSPGVLQCFDVHLGGGLRWQRRFDAWSPKFHFVGDRLLVVDRVDGHLPGLPNQIRAYDGRTGKPLWTTQVPKGLNRVIPLEDVVLFYRENHQLMAIDGRSGKKLWGRRFPPPQMMRLMQGEGQVHLVLVSRVRTVSHLTLDLHTGETVTEHQLPVPLVENEPTGAKEAPGGYLEVRTEPVRARYVRLVALSEVSKRDHTTIGDLRVIGTDGSNLPRDRWRVHFVDSFDPSGYEDPSNAIDEDIVSWWHTVWKQRGDKHPHEIQLDLGRVETVTGIRYLPATIRTGTGMIKDYELYYSERPNEWGQPVAKGIMAARPKVVNLHSREKGVAFEARYQHTDSGSVLHYGLDGKGMQMARAHGRVVLHTPDYFVSNKLNDREGNHFVVHRFDDTTYRFDLGPMTKQQTGGLKIVENLLTMGPNRATEIDLLSKRFLKR